MELHLNFIQRTKQIGILRGTAEFLFDTSPDKYWEKFDHANNIWISNMYSIAMVCLPQNFAHNTTFDKILYRFQQYQIPALRQL